MRRGLLPLEEERDDEREQNERLDERQAENHRRLDARGSARVTGDAFEGRGCCAPLTETTAEHAANKIFRAVEANRAEITITPQAWFAARTAGLFPETLQFANALINRFVLPKPPA